MVHWSLSKDRTPSPQSPPGQRSAREGLEHPLPHCSHPCQVGQSSSWRRKVPDRGQQPCLHICQPWNSHSATSRPPLSPARCSLSQHHNRTCASASVPSRPQNTQQELSPDLRDLPSPLLSLLPAAGKVFQPGLAAIPGSWCEKSAHFHPKSHGGSANDLAWTWGER